MGSSGLGRAAESDEAPAAGWKSEALAAQEKEAMPAEHKGNQKVGAGGQRHVT